MIRTLTWIIAWLSAGSFASAQEPKTPSDPAAQQARIAEYLKGLDGAPTARIGAQVGDGLAATFPDHTIFSVLFPQFPVGRIPPPPLKSSNLFAVPKKDGKVIPLTTIKEWDQFFQAHHRAIKSAEDASAATTAYLRGVAELNQDGFFKFTVKAEMPKLEGGTGLASGQATVDPQGGNKGEVKTTVNFKDGRFASAETKVTLSAGIRPICQATKLLDPDPIVRAMAEQSIRVMGSLAKPYLDEQRAKASPELKQAIDRMWQRIQDEKR
jgi:hypothetical protein